MYKKFVGAPNSFKLTFKLFIVFIVFVYFIFHAVTGENGLFSYMSITKKVEDASLKLNELKNTRDYLDRNVQLLGNKTLDLDILDERCRYILNYASADDVIIKTNRG
jgi:cell division protein FtsB